MFRAVVLRNVPAPFRVSMKPLSFKRESARRRVFRSLKASPKTLFARKFLLFCELSVKNLLPQRLKYCLLHAFHALNYIILCEGTSRTHLLSGTYGFQEGSQINGRVVDLIANI